MDILEASIYIASKEQLFIGKITKILCENLQYLTNFYIFYKNYPYFSQS